MKPDTITYEDENTDKDLESTLRKTCSAEIKRLQKDKWKLIDTDFDDGEVRIVYQHPEYENITITLMFQEEF